MTIGYKDFILMYVMRAVDFTDESAKNDDKEVSRIKMMSQMLYTPDSPVSLHLLIYHVSHLIDDDEIMCTVMEQLLSKASDDERDVLNIMFSYDYKLLESDGAKDCLYQMLIGLGVSPTESFNRIDMYKAEVIGMPVASTSKVA